MNTKDHPELADHHAVGGLGVLHLQRLWSRGLRDRAGLGNSAASSEWPLDNVIYHGLNLPIEETIQYLYQTGPTLEEFEQWILVRNGGVLRQNDVERINAAIDGLLSVKKPESASGGVEKILTDSQIDFWNEHGYLVVPELFEAEEVTAAESAVWNHVGADPGDPETWYRHKSDHGIMVQFFHHPALETIRRSAKVRSVFAQVWNTNDLWISTDRVSFNPPERPGFEFPGPDLHWDVSLEPPIPFGVQGLVYLCDTTAEQGAFTCVPGFHNRMEAWLKSLPVGADPRNEDVAKLGATPIAGKAGDLIIWHQALPHGSSPNRATRPRIVEYVTMFPADADYAENWK